MLAHSNSVLKLIISGDWRVNRLRNILFKENKETRPHLQTKINTAITVKLKAVWTITSSFYLGLRMINFEYQEMQTSFFVSFSAMEKEKKII